MKQSQVLIAESDAQIAACFAALQELRPHLKDAADLIARVRRQQQEGYVLAYIAGPDGQAVACMGFRRQERLVHGKVIYVDDLVTRASERSKQHGAALLDWLEALARQEGYGVVDLDSGTHRTDAHRFYHRQKYIVSAFHFLKRIAE